MHPHNEHHQWRQGCESGGQAKGLEILPLIAFLLCISGDGDVDGRQSICDDVELIFFRFCSWEGSISLVMGKPKTGCLYLAYCRASMIHLISRQTSSVCFEMKWWKTLKEMHFRKSPVWTIFHTIGFYGIGLSLPRFVNYRQIPIGCWDDWVKWRAWEFLQRCRVLCSHTWSTIFSPCVIVKKHIVAERWCVANDIQTSECLLLCFPCSGKDETLYIKLTTFVYIKQMLPKSSAVLKSSR